MSETVFNQQFQDLSALWETLVTGNPLPAVFNLEVMREEMWKDLQASFLHNVLPHKKLTRNFELENKLKLRNNPHEQSLIEIALLRDYTSQLHGQKFSWASTPLMSQKMDWGLDCVGSSLLLASLLNSLPIHGHVWIGSVIGHAMLIYYDVMGEAWFVDSHHNRIFQLMTRGEEKPGGKIYHLVEDDRTQIKAPFKLLHVFPADAGSLLFILGNLEGRKNNFFDRGSPEQLVNHSYQELLDKQSWGHIGFMLCPETYLMGGEEWDQESSRMQQIWAEQFDNIEWN